MAQVSDFILDNQGFSSFRTELNNILAAQNSNNSGTSRPASATTGTLWLDTTNAGSNTLTLKFFDGSDDITLANIDTSANTVNFIDSSVSAATEVLNDTSPQLGGNLDTNSHNIDIDDAHGIRDENANEQLIFETTSSAVNHIDITNAATGSSPQIGAVGGDSNVDLKLRPKGTGNIEVMGATNPGSIQLNCESNSHGIKLTSPAHSAGQSYELKFPTGNVTAGKFLKVDTVSGSGATGVGQLSFADAGGGTSWQSVKTANFNASAGEGYFVDTSSGSITATLPASPSIGDTFEFKDYAQTFGTNKLLLDPNGNKFEGLNDRQHSAEQNRQSITVTFSDSTKGYVLTGSANSTASSNSGLFNIEAPPYSADYVCVAGGSSSTGSFGGGGGGAGGYRSSYSNESSGGGASAETALSFTPGNVYTITVGAGGNEGTDSSIAGAGITTVTSIGGGRGGRADGTEDGGSGGGGSGSGNVAKGNGTANQGKDGGVGSGGNYYHAGGGGGGAANVGGAGNIAGAPGAGGNGVTSTITGSSVDRAGGGAGGQQAGSPGGNSSGGNGGGGNGNVSSGTDGTANTGGGAGGGEHTGGQGGSGVVILRLPTSNYSGTTTGSPTVTTVGSDTVIQFNSSGSYTA